MALSATGLPAGTVIMGNGTSTSRYPLGSFYGYERSAALYTADEIGVGNKRINTLGWYPTSSSDDTVPTKIYLKEYSGNTLTSDTWANLTAGAIPVYDATITDITGGDWYLLQLDNSFDLDSGNNLLVLVERNHGGNGGFADSGTPAIHATMMSNMHHILQQDNNPPTSNSNNQAMRPNLMFLSTSYELTDPPNPAIVQLPADGAQMVSLDAQLSWISGGGGPMGYKLYLGTTNPPAFVEDLGATLSYNPGILAADTHYYWQIVPYNSCGDAINCPIWSFETLPSGMVIIGDGTNTQRQPFGHNWGYERSAAIYTADELGVVGNLLTVAWDCASTSTIAVPYKIYVGSTISTALIADSWDNFKQNLTLAKEGTHTFSETEWNHFTLDNPFLCAGENLIIAVETNYGGFGQSPSANFRYTNSNSNSHMYWYGDNVPPSAPSTTNALRPNVMLQLAELLETPPAPPLLVSPVNGAMGLPIEGFELKWRPDLLNGGMPEYYSVFLADDEDEIFDQVFFEIPNANTTSFNPCINPPVGEPMTFNYGESWFWTVQAFNIHGDTLAEHAFRFEIEHDPTIHNLPYSEGFEGDVFPPEGWKIVDADGDGQNWLQYLYDPHLGNCSAASASWYEETTLYPDNWLITPPIVIPESGNYLVEYYVAAQDEEYSNEHYGFYVSATASSNPADFSLLHEETLESAQWQHRHFNLTDYLGQTVRFAFRHFDSSNIFYMKIDDVQVREIPDTPTLSIIPSEHDFGEIHLMTPSNPKSFSISNAGGGSLEIGAADIWLDPLAEDFVLIAENLPVELSGFDVYDLKVQFIPQSLGYKTASLYIQDNTTRAIHQINLSGTGVEEPIASVILLDGWMNGVDSVELQWLSIYGDPNVPGYVHWDDGIQRSFVGADDNEYHVAVMYGSEITQQITDKVIDAVMIHINEDPQSVDYVKIWAGTDDDVAPNTLLYEQAVSGLNVGWNHIVLNTPVPADIYEAIMVGYHVNGIVNSYPGSTDGLLSIDGRGNLINVDDDWFTLEEADIGGNWLIHTHFENSAASLASRRTNRLHPVSITANTISPEDLRHQPFLSRANENAPRGILGFNIYRDGVQVNTDVVADYAYIDENLTGGIFEYAVQSVNHSALGPMSITVTVVVPDPPAPFALPFTESWASSSFYTNMWSTVGSNWSVSYTGNPTYAANFSWNPQVQDYSIPLSSHSINAIGIDHVELNFDLYLNSYGVSYNAMAWEIWDGSRWNTVGSVDNQDGSIDWTTITADLTQYAANRIFKLRFRAFGEDSYDINNWYIDNIEIKESIGTLDAVTDLSVSFVENAAILNWSAVPGAQWYAIYVSNDPYGDFEYLDYVTTAGGLEVPAAMMNLDKLFVRVTAGAGDPPALRKLDVSPAASKK